MEYIMRSDNTVKRVITIYRTERQERKRERNEYFFVKKIVSRISRHCYITIEATCDTQWRETARKCDISS